VSTNGHRGGSGGEVVIVIAAVVVSTAAETAGEYERKQRPDAGQGK
jgi:hypothetical protein